MKVEKPSSASVQDSATLLGGVVAGGALSKGLIGLIHEDKTGLTEETQKKQDNTRMLKRAALVVAGIAGASAIQGKDTVAVLVKGALTGIAGAQALELVSDFSSKNDAVKSAVAGTSVTKKFLARTLGVSGLGCPCGNNALNGTRRKRALRSYVPETYEAIPMRSGNSLDAIVNAGRMSA